MSKGKIAITVIFAILVFLVLVAVGFFGVSTALQFRELLDARDSLRTHNRIFEESLSEWEGDLADTARFRISSDSIRNALSVSQSNFAEGFSEKNGLNRTPDFQITETDTIDGWVNHHFNLTLTGSPDAVEAYMQKLGNDFPLLYLENLEGTLKRTNIVLDIVGSLQFPEKS